MHCSLDRSRSLFYFVPHTRWLVYCSQERQHRRQVVQHTALTCTTYYSTTNHCRRQVLCYAALHCYPMYSIFHEILYKYSAGISAQERPQCSEGVEYIPSYTKSYIRNISQRTKCAVVLSASGGEAHRGSPMQLGAAIKHLVPGQGCTNHMFCMYLE